MTLRDRHLTRDILDDLQEKMAFVGGPRQVGKTTLATELVARHFKRTAYYNWDNRSDRRRILSSDWPGAADLIVLDEIHKHKGWKRLIKGEYDKLKDRYKFMITGSSRLDVYRKGGDSLQGRYHYHRLHPFSLAELLGERNVVEPLKEIPVSGTDAAADLAGLELFGGFPEPLMRQSHRVLRRWHNEKIERLFREDIRDMEPIRDLDSMRLLSDMLPGKVGSLLSANSLREDLSVSHRTVSRWLRILESFYYQFTIHPHAKGRFRAVKKEPKLYLWDWSEVSGEAARFENMIASHLLKLAHHLYDREGHRVDLRFLRDRSGREVDFLMLLGEKPWFAVEVKLNDEQPSSSLAYFKERLDIPFAYQVLRKTGVDKLVGGIRVLSADRMLSGLV